MLSLLGVTVQCQAKAQNSHQRAALQSGKDVAVLLPAPVGISEKNNVLISKVVLAVGSKSLVVPEPFSGPWRWCGFYQK